MHRNQEAGPRRVARAVTCLALGLAAALSFGGTAVADQAGTEERITSSGERPLAPVSVPNYGTTTREGAPVAVVVSGGMGGKLNVVDLSSGKPVVQRDFADETKDDVQPWGFATLSDKSVLIAAGLSGLWRYDPDGDTVEHLSEDKAGVTDKAEFFWDIAVDENDTAYIATFAGKKHSGGHVLTWSKDNGLGLLKGGDPVDAGQPQARSIAYDNGKVYVAVGATAPKIYQIDPRTGAKNALELPAGVCAGGSGGLVPHLEAKAGKLYAESCNERQNVMYDLASGMPGEVLKDAGVDPVRDVGGKIISRPGEARKVYYVRAGQLVEYDPDTNKHTPLPAGNQLLGRLSPNSWATHDVFVSSQMNRGDLTIHDATKQGADSVTKVDGNDALKAPGRAIQSMVAADNGKLFASWYMTADQLLGITPGEKADGTTVELLDSPTGQGEGMAVNGGTLVVGLYPGAKVTSRSTENGGGYEPGGEYDKAYNESPTKKAVDGQDRPYAITHTEGSVFAIGTVPKDGQLGGALAFYDTSTRTIQDKVYKFDGLSYANGVPQDRLAKQSPISMAYRGGKLYIGTTVRGGHSVEAEKEEAHLVEFDVASGTVTRILNPFEGEGQKAITALTFGDDGQLHGITGNYVFTVDPTSLGITGKKSVIGGDEKEKVAEAGKEVNRSWLIQHNGTLYGVLGGNLYAIRASDLTVTGGKPIAEKVSALALGKDGYLYYARGSDIYRNDHAKTGR